MSTRTYCVIPHEARQDTSFFQGVFEDGVRVLYRGRLQSLVFSHVLSPAHDYVKHINGPLLATLRDGNNATLILAIPNSEDVVLSPKSTASGVRGPTSQAQADAATAPSRVPPLSSSSQKLNTGSAEATAVAMELYANLFPLLFRNLECCSAALLSVVTVSASERILLDNLREDRHIRTLEEAHKVNLTRSTSATEWGTLLQLLEDRHAALQESPTSLEGQTACVVTVELQGYGRLVVVDAASAQDLLQQLTLVLHMRADGAARTYPPHTPIRDLLERNVAPQATVQVLIVPAPQDTVRQTMRVLHFAATVEAAQNCGATAVMDEESGSMASNSRPPRRRAVQLSPAPSKLFSRPRASPTPLAVDASPTRNKGADSSPQPVVTPAALHLDVDESSRSDSSCYNADIVRDRTPAQLPPPSVQLDRDRQRAREQHFLKRIAVLEEQLRSSEDQCHRAQITRDQALEERNGFERELRGKTSLWTDLQRAHQTTKKENADYAQLVERLVRQVRTLERDATRQKRQGSMVVKQLREAETEKETLMLQLTGLRKEVMLFRKDAIWRAREATLSRIVPGEASVPEPRAAAQRQSSQSRPAHQPGPRSVSFTSTSGVGLHSPRARRIYERPSNTEGFSESTNGDAPSLAQEERGRLTTITMDELRWRNRHLEQEVNRLQERLLATFTATAKRDTTRDASSGSMSDVRCYGGCPMCDVMQERIEYFQTELAHVREEKEALVRLMSTSSASFPPRNTKTPISANLERSCSRVMHSPPRSSEVRRDGSEEDGVTPSSRSTPHPAKSSFSGCTLRVAAALVTGCSSLEAQLACAQMALSCRLRSDTSASAQGNSELFDPLSQLSPLVLQEHQEAVAALADSLRHIAEKPASRPAATGPTAFPASSRDTAAAARWLLPPIPRCATAADVDTLTNYLSFEMERCQHLRAFIPTFAQLAVATEHLTMRLEATDAKSN
ncbi:conserved hypothetical protein [Leishmania braziliensis MHOM/BR/75/M2904]|uniref:Kinesin motor domain-containing protein n=2 Tax=Leishmania braziliensis TaxID=5660 RepID=A4HKK0_LEIBR|nr:conserved hypothetical protein [Leishmania braziliensis MHOM/BR/75/M2904]KAI5687614.1 hypothetical protein MNV84_06671 [Leishmania braziliensis]CAJ2478677.1 unnamed protein product [Leishmania braziliensis]CAM43026.1 conserved hypothetical protein [Leishmania braziliensis MHOM/BR/75/M2904]SYZ68730.1 hypothetical_protein [Leishmania braziliensis MHOM/BR/75/M2904]